jgi:hypothetical protein
LRALAVTGVVVLIAVGAFFAGEAIARGIVQERVREALVTELALPAEQRIDVSVGGMVIPQLVVGRLDDLRVTASDLELDGLSGDVDARVHGLPVRGDDVDGVGGTATIGMDAADVEALLVRADGPWSALGEVGVSLPGPEATFSAELSVFGAGIPLEFSAVPGVSGGDVVVTPESVRVGELELTADTIAEAPVDLSALTRPLTICRADALPDGLLVEAVDVAPGRLTIRLDFADGFLSGPDPLAEGGCA